MSEESPNLFDGVQTVIADPLRFKAKLAIGEDAYKSLRLTKYAREAWDTIGAAGTGAVVAQSTVVASTFFAPSGILGVLGIGTAATPIGWVVLAAAVAGGAWVGVSKVYKNVSGDMVTVIPDFINTPMDVLAVGIFDLLAPLALKVAIVDGNIHETEREVIKKHFVNDWGFDSKYVDQGLSIIESKISDYSIIEVAQYLAEFQKSNPDCNFDEMSREVLVLLREVIEADGMIDEREDMAIEKVASIFEEAKKLHLGDTIKAGISSTMKSIGSLSGRIGNLSDRILSKR